MKLCQKAFLCFSFHSAYATFGNIFGFAIVIQGLSCVFLFCFVAYCIMMTNEFDATIPGIAVLSLMQLFIPCHLINELENLTGSFCYNIYESHWIGADRHRLQDLRILMETTKKPIVMKVAHLFTLNLKTFLDVSCKLLTKVNIVLLRIQLQVVQWAYAVFALIAHFKK